VGPSWHDAFVVFRILCFGVCTMCKRHCIDVLGLDQISLCVGAVLPSAHVPAPNPPTSCRCLGRSPPTSSETGRPITDLPMSALGHKQTYAVHQLMSALPSIATAKADSRKSSCLLLPLKADMCGALVHVGFGPIADMRSAKRQPFGKALVPCDRLSALNGLDHPFLSSDAQCGSNR
jgi:hypothetical protein